MLFDELARRAPSAVAIGDFDGVHLGHAAIIAKLADVSASNGLTPVAITFDVNTKNSMALLDGKTKAALLKDCGAKYVLTADFDKIKNMPADIFAASLAEAGTKYVVCGMQFAFGKDALGNADTLKKAGIRTLTVPYVDVDGAHVSSTRIRHALANGNISLARRLTGRERDFYDA